MTRETQPHVLDYLRILWRRRNLGLVVALTVAFAAAYRTSQKSPYYSASAQIAVEPESSQNLLYDASRYDAYWYRLTDLATQEHIIRSEPVATRVVEMLSLTPEAPGANTLQAQVDMVRGAISIEQVEGTHMFYVTAGSENPEMAAKLANATAKAYIEFQSNRRMRSSQRALTWMRDQLGELEERFQQSQLELIDYIEREGFPAARGGDPQGGVVDAYTRLAQENDRSNTEIIRLEAQLATLSRYAGREVSAGALRGLTGGDDAIQDLASRLNGLEIELAENRKRYGEKHPTIISLTQRIEALQSDASRTLERRIAAVEAKLRAARDEKAGLAGAVAGANRQRIEAAKKGIRFEILSQKAESDRNLYSIIQKKLEELDLTTGAEEANITLLEAARPPTRPVRPDKPREYLLAVLLGLALGVGTAFALEYLDRSIKSSDEAEALLQLPVLASLHRIDPPDPAGATDLLLDPVHPAEAEVFRNLRTNLRFASTTDSLVLLVTSGSPREGKTTVAINLAATFAAAGSRVLLVDADLRRPQIHERLRLPNAVGLSTYLSRQADLPSVAQPTTIPGFTVLTSGPVAPNPSDLLESDQVDALLGAALESYDIVIFDSPPAAAITDAWHLARRVSGILLVMHAVRSDRSQILRARAQLLKAGGHLLGVMLNEVSFKEHAEYGYYPAQRTPEGAGGPATSDRPGGIEKLGS